MKKILIFIFVFLIIVMPVFSSAVQDLGAKGLVTCTKDCDFTDLMILINKIIHFVLFYLALPIAAVMFFYAGFKMVTSGGSAEAKTSAKNIFTNAVIGLVIAAGAWLIISTILSILSPEGVHPWAWIGFK